MKSFSERRKIVESIPSETFYCYRPLTNMHVMEDGKYGFKIEPCKFYKHESGLFGKCKLYKCEVIDQVKSCGLRE